MTTTALAGGLMLTGHFLLYTYVAPLLQQLGGHDARDRAVLLLVFGLAGPVGIALSGPLSDRFPRRRWPASASPWPPSPRRRPPSVSARPSRRSSSGPGVC